MSLLSTINLFGEGESFREGAAEPPLFFTPLSSQWKLQIAIIAQAGEGSGVR